MSKDYVVNFEGPGRFSDDGAHRTAPEDVDRIFADVLPQSGLQHVVLHFHGGLVKEADGLEIADRLAPRYRADGEALPIHVVWETGFWEVLPRALGDLATDGTFFERMLRWGLEKLGGEFLQSAETDEVQRIESFDVGAVTDADLSDEAGKSLDDGTVLEALVRGMKQDKKLEAMLREIVNAAEVEESQSDDGAGPEIVAFPEGEKKVHYVSKNFVAQLVVPEEVEEEEQIAGEAVFAYNAAKTLVSVGRRVWKRKEDPRTWHGFRETFVEELIRELILIDHFGQAVWGRMKRNAAAAYADGAAGAYLVDRLGGWLDEDGDRRITLVGHSAGSFHVGHVATRLLASPSRSVDQVLLLAPACDHEFFDGHIAPHAGRVKRFRMFTMDDEHECADELLEGTPVAWLYKRSLLFLVSGVLESTPAVPLLGMQRWLSALPDASARLLEAHAESVVLSPTDSSDLGLRTTSVKHGDFDNDEPTIESLLHLIGASS